MYRVLYQLVARLCKAIFPFSRVYELCSYIVKIYYLCFTPCAERIDQAEPPNPPKPPVYSQVPTSNPIAIRVPMAFFKNFRERRAEKKRKKRIHKIENEELKQKLSLMRDTGGRGRRAEEAAMAPAAAPAAAPNTDLAIRVGGTVVAVVTGAVAMIFAPTISVVAVAVGLFAVARVADSAATVVGSNNRMNAFRLALESNERATPKGLPLYQESTRAGFPWDTREDFRLDSRRDRRLLS